MGTRPRWSQGERAARPGGCGFISSLVLKIIGVPATRTVPMAGMVCSSRSLRATRARSHESISGRTRPLQCPRSTSSWKPSRSSMLMPRACIAGEARRPGARAASARRRDREFSRVGIAKARVAAQWFARRRPLAMMSNKRAALDVRGLLFWTTAFVARYGNLGAGFRNRSFRNGGFRNIILDGGCGWRRRTCWVRAWLSGAEPAMRRRPEDTRAESLSRDAPVTGFSALRGTRARPCGCSRKAGFPPFDNEILNPPQ